ncbi:nuclear exosome regulator NRDE2, partial [Caerostris extrusa]
DSIRSQLNKKTFIEETGLSFERAFRVDQNGDFENNHYDCLEKKKTASYKRFPEVPVGCSSQEKSVWLQTSTHNPKKDVPRYFSKKALKLLLKTGRASEVCTLRKVPGVPSVASSFISLVQLTSNNKNSTLDQSKANFDGVSLSWKSTESEYMDESESKNMDENKYDSSFKSELKNNILFNQRVRETPHDIQLWLDFVNFQEEFYSSQKSEEANELVSEQYIIDKKIAILDKALKHNPKNVQLNIEKLKLGPHIWKRGKVMSCWDELLFLYPNNAQIWKEYIIFILTNLTYFSIPRVLKIFSKCIRTLSDLSEGIIVSHQAPPDIINNMLDIFNQLVFILKSCGYTEKAIAAFQALIEFNLFSKQSIESLSVSEQIICFEPFWDSGAARFGEDEAIGWATTVEKNKISFKKLVTQSDLSNTEEDILYQKYPEWKTWLKFERLRESHHWLPWRPNPEYDQTEDDIDDIDRTISFDDISKFIFRVSNEEHKFLLLHNFLTFLGFNPHLFGCYNHSAKEMNCQITIVNFDILSKKLNDSLFNEQDSNPFLFKTTVWNAEHVNFMKMCFFKQKEKFSFRYKVLFLHLWLKYLQKVALECNIDAENMGSVQKFVKNILKEPENRNCLLLWFEYIKIESCCASKKKAKKTTETLFSSSISAVNGGCMPMKELWYFVRSYIDFSLNIQESCVSDNELFSPSEIIWLLIHIGCKEKYVPYSNELIKPTQILKAVSGFKSFLNEELSSMANTKNGLCYCLDPYTYSLIDCIKCFAYLQYFYKVLMQLFKF